MTALVLSRRSNNYPIFFRRFLFSVSESSLSGAGALGQQHLDVGHQFLGFDVGIVAPHRFALPIDEEFLKVPADVAVAQVFVEQFVGRREEVARRRTLFLKECIEAMFVHSIDFDSSEERDIGLEITARTNVADAVVELHALRRLLLLV